jgi:DNA-binding NarL/FixJ family response regulator
MIDTCCGPRQLEMISRLRADHPNLRAALEWSMSRPGEYRSGMALASALRYHWHIGGLFSEGQRWLMQSLELVKDPVPERGEALWVAAWTALVCHRRAQAAAMIQECAELAETLDDDRLRTHAAHWAGAVALFNGDHGRAVELFDEALAGHRQAGDEMSFLIVMLQKAFACTYAGDTGRAREIELSAIRTCDRYGERSVRARLHWAAGVTAWRERDLETAELMAQEALSVQQGFHDGICVGHAIELLAWIAAARSEFVRSAALLGAARAVWTEVGTDVVSFGHSLGGDSLECERAAREALGFRFDSLVRARASLSMDQAIAFATGCDAIAPRSGAEDDKSPLSPRERDVAGLIAQGLSNKGIAERLVLSPRTVDGHVERILAKLGFSSRTQVAAWVAERATAAGHSADGVSNRVISP